MAYCLIIICILIRSSVLRLQETLPDLPNMTKKMFPDLPNMIEKMFPDLPNMT